MTELESVATCPVCGSHQFTPFLITKDFTVTREEFNIIKCETCRLAITSPRPTSTSISRYYESANYISHSGGTGSLLDAVYKRVRTYAVRKKLDLISRFITSGALLDYGSGTGDFLLGANRRGWSCVGVEPSENAQTKSPAGIKVHATLDAVTGTFDVITLWHVLEHVHKLNETIQLLRSKLRPGGIIFIAVPNHESHDAVLYGKQWAGYDVPRHLWHFTKSTMTSLLKSQQLDVVDIRPMKFDAFYVSLLSESYKTGRQTIMGVVRAAVTGLRSNAAAGQDNYSSLIYIARS